MVVVSNLIRATTMILMKCLVYVGTERSARPQIFTVLASLADIHGAIYLQHEKCGRDNIRSHRYIYMK